jgi:hypothetical protein
MRMSMSVMGGDMIDEFMEPEGDGMLTRPMRARGRMVRRREDIRVADNTPSPYQAPLRVSTITMWYVSRDKIVMFTTKARCLRQD